METVQGPDSGNQAQIDRMVTLYEKDLLRLCCVYLRDAALARDAVSETFFKAYKNLNAFRGECQEKTWLTHIAVNTCKDIRKNAWYRFVDRRIALENLPLPSAPPSEEHVALTTEIMRLPRKLMEVVLLYYYQSMTLKEIAQALGVTPAAVSGRLDRARKRLHAALEGGPENERG